MRTRLVPVVPVVALLLLAACGGGGSSKSSSTSAPTTSTTEASTPTSAGSDAAATAKAQKLVLVQADFPPGWTGTPPTPDTPDDKATSAEFAACIGVSGADAKSADVKGDDFSMGSPVTQVGSEAEIVKDEATYRHDVAALKSSKVQSCTEQFLTKVVTKQAGSPPTNVQVSPITVPTFGDVTLGIRMSAGITAAGQTIPLVVDVVLMGKNRAEITGTFSNAGTPFDQALETTLINKLGEKLNANA